VEEMKTTYTPRWDLRPKKQFDASGGVESRHPQQGRTCTSPASGNRPSQDNCGLQGSAGVAPGPLASPFKPSHPLFLV
jgi:hypothetical protein